MKICSKDIYFSKTKNKYVANRYNKGRRCSKELYSNRLDRAKWRNDIAKSIRILVA